MASTGNVFAGTGENNAGIGATAWTNPGNITSDNATDATCNAAASSQYLVARNFGFAVPTGATIAGITVRIDASEHSAGSETVNARLQDDGGALVGSTKTASVNGTTKTVYTYGSTSDVWGATLTPAIVNDVDFGVRLWFTTAHDVRIDFVTLAVEYTEGTAALTGSASTTASGTATPASSKAATGSSSTTASGSVVQSGAAPLVGSAITSAQGDLARSRGLGFTAEQGSLAPTNPLSGQAITSGQGSVSVGTDGVDESLSGSAVTSDAGSTSSGMIVRVHSRKVGGGSASRSLAGAAVPVSIGAVTPAPAKTPTSIAALLSAGAFGKSRNIPISGSALTSGVGSVVASGGSFSGAGNPVSFTLNSSTIGAKPFSVGHAFKQGDFSGGIEVTGATAQVVPKNYWTDGSIKFAVVSGTYNQIAGGTPVTVTLSNGPSSVGTALTTAQLKAALPQPVSVLSDAFGGATWSGSDWDAPFQTWVSGHLMSSWIYRKQIGSDSHLVAWLEVRYYSTGAVEVFPWVENGYLTVAGPTNKSATYSFTFGGATRFSQAIDIKHHTRIPLITGSTFSYWLGTDPAVTPAHNTAYLRSTKVIPNVGDWGSATSTTLNALQQTYTPNTLAGDTNATGDSGGSGSIISGPSAHYISSGGDSRAFKAMLVHGMSSGSWSHHYRDENTNLPLAFSSYPSISLSGSSSPPIPAESGGVNQPSGTRPAMSHLPGYAYLPYLVTGRWWFLEETHFWATYAYLNLAVTTQRGGSAGIHDGGQIRQRAWSLNVLGQAAAITPTTHPLQSEFVSSWQSNMSRFGAKFVDGTYTTDGNWVNPLGVVGTYSGSADASSPWPPTNATSAWWDAAYMHNYLASVLGYTSEIGVPQSAQSLSDHQAVRNHSYKFVVGRAGSGASGTYNWRRFIAFAVPIGTDGVGLPVETPYTSFSQVYSELRSGYSLADIPATPGLSLKQHSSDTDLTNSDSSRTYGSTALAALSMAVDHGAEGAALGYERVTGASNYATAFTSFLTDDEPQWSIKPRAPDYVSSMSAYQVRALSGSYTPTNGYETMQSVTPAEWLTNDPGNSDLAGLLSPWSGGAKGTTYLDVQGGGHGDSANNGNYRFDPSGTTRPTGWSVIQQSAVSAVPAQSSNSETYLDGRPPAWHTYDGLVTASDGSLYRFYGGFWSSGGYSPTCWKLSGGSWTRLPNWPGVTGGQGQANTIYDASTNKILVLISGPVYDARFFYCDSGTFSSGKTISNLLSANGINAWDPTRGRALNLNQNDARLITADFSAETVSVGAALAGGITALVNRGLSLVYDAQLDCYWAFGGANGDAGWDNLYRIDASTLAVTTTALTGDAISEGSQIGSFGRFCFKSEWRAIFVCAAHNQPVYVIRLPSA